ncbi:hypothetical protein GGD38_004793 [Chitinophagaceae bacterium OAS944]|nr:hypothetical protein [Chitinophagaceae bacterium OAS944]
MNTAFYINNLNFVETWSFNREDDGTLSMYAFATEEGLFQPGSKRTGTFKKDHPTAERIKQILQTEIEISMSYLCAPVYRDALVFYDKNDKVISILNICLTCLHMTAENIPDVKGDYKAYEWLKRLFIELGHAVENPGYSIIEDFDKMKAKVRKKKEQ